MFSLAFGVTKDFVDTFNSYNLVFRILSYLVPVWVWFYPILRESKDLAVAIWTLTRPRI